MMIGRILDFSNANMAVDQYHRFQVTSTLLYLDRDNNLHQFSFPTSITLHV